MNKRKSKKYGEVKVFDSFLKKSQIANSCKALGNNFQWISIDSNYVGYVRYSGRSFLYAMCRIQCVYWPSNRCKILNLVM